MRRRREIGQVAVDAASNRDGAIGSRWSRQTRRRRRLTKQLWGGDQPCERES